VKGRPTARERWLLASERNVWRFIPVLNRSDLAPAPIQSRINEEIEGDSIGSNTTK